MKFSASLMAKSSPNGPKPARVPNWKGKCTLPTINLIRNLLDLVAESGWSFWFGLIEAPDALYRQPLRTGRVSRGGYVGNHHGQSTDACSRSLVFLCSSFICRFPPFSSQPLTGRPQGFANGALSVLEYHTWSLHGAASLRGMEAP